MNNHKKRFNKWSNKYDNCILQSIVFWETHNIMIRKLIPYLKRDIKILDVACGTGNFLLRLQSVTRYNAKLYGMDISEGMIFQANKKNSAINWKVGNVRELPYLENTFDIITCSHAFHHFRGFQCKFLEEARRILRKGGKIYIADSSIDNLWGKILFGKIINKIEKNVNHVNKIVMRRLLEEIGFKVIQQIQYNKLAPTLLTIGEKQ